VWHEWRIPDPIVQFRIFQEQKLHHPTILLIVLTFSSYGMQILNPVFLQDFARLHCVEGRAGDGAARVRRNVCDVSAGRNCAPRLRHTSLVMTGFLLIGAATWQLGTLNLQHVDFELHLATLVQGIGMGLVFPNLSGRRRWVRSVARRWATRPVSTR